MAAAAKMTQEQEQEMAWEVTQELAAGNVPHCPECEDNQHIRLLGIVRGGPKFGCECGVTFGTFMFEYPA